MRARQRHSAAQLAGLLLPDSCRARDAAEAQRLHAETVRAMQGRNVDRQLSEEKPKLPSQPWRDGAE